MKPEIVILERIDTSEIKIISKFADIKFLVGLPRKKYLEKIKNATAIIIKSVTKVDSELVNKAKKLKIVVRAGTGLDNINTNLLERKNIKLISTPRANAISTAEFTLMQILNLCKRMPDFYPKIQKKDFRRHLFEGRELSKMNVGIIGVGNVGFEVAKRLKPFECKIYAYEKNLKNILRFKKLGGTCVGSLNKLITKVDILTIHLNLTKENRNILNKNHFNKIRKNIILINCARAELINDNALISALKSKKISYAAIDVINPEPNYDKKKNHFNHKLLKAKNIFYTPHLAASTIDAQKKISKELALELVKFLKKLKKI
tara:strand:- start:889 stop:1842 length:954 start_codon:yes stop_codon:yes gene_type:complete